ncbi:MAG TPA: hypothetical protein VGB06_11065 [Solirubrobacterales bacterium]|jgi:hypothetical protein
MTGVEKRRRGDLSDDEVADVDVSTSVRARELRFETVPETKLSFDGEPGQRHSSETERENLPEEVEPGETYRDVGLRWRARARIVHPTDPDA